MHHAEYKLWFVCVLVQERVKQDVGPFPKEEDRILSWCSLGEEGAGSVAVRNRNGREKNPGLFSFPFAC